MPKYQGCFSFVGGIFIIIALGNILPFSTVNYYLTDRESKEKMSWKGLMLFSLPLCITNSMNIFSLTLSSVVGPQLLSIMGFVLIGGGYSLLYMYKELTMHYIAVTLIGVGIGIQFNPIIRNVWQYYPESKAFISIFYLLTYGASSVFITIFSEYVFSQTLSLKEIQASILSQKRQSYFSIILIASCCSGIFGILLTSNYTNYNNNLLEESTENLINPSLLFEGSINNEDDIFNNTGPSENITKCSEIISFWYMFGFLLTSKRFWLIVFLYMLSFFFCAHYTHHLRFIGIFNHFDNNVIIQALFTYSISIAIGRVLICLLYSCFKFKGLFCLILFSQIAIGVLAVLFVNERLYLTYTAIAGFCYAGTTSLFSSLMAKMCGNDHSFELGGFVNALGSLSSIALPFALHCIGDTVNDDQLMLECFSYSSSFASMLALVVCVSFDTTPFDFSDIKKTNRQMWKESTIDKNQSHNFIDKSFFNNSDKNQQKTKLYFD